jgi:hypothetical protein
MPRCLERCAVASVTQTLSRDRATSLANRSGEGNRQVDAQGTPQSLVHLEDIYRTLDL